MVFQSSRRGACLPPAASSSWEGVWLLSILPAPGCLKMNLLYSLRILALGEKSSGDSLFFQTLLILSRGIHVF